ncbi:MAG: DUF2252 domain-containing protein [Chloroflexi bacterium]|nr:DUF2252 domain-containing protein [Chloroflexota bacterium]
MSLDNPQELSRAERYKKGKALRQKAPRSSHGDWQPATERPNPLDLLQAQDEGRLQHLLPIKYGRMLASPFAFLRGSAVVMASDLAHTPTSGLEVILCGDAHLSNFGLFASPERRLVFDLNDFDEAFPGPWEWDVKRLAASVAVAGRDNGFSDKTNRSLAQEGVRAYRRTMIRFAEMSTLDVWYFYVDADALQDVFAERATKNRRKKAQKFIDKARSKTQEQTLAKLTYIDSNGRRRIRREPPLLIPLRAENLTQLVDTEDLAAISETAVEESWQQYLQSLDDEKKFLLSRYKIVDAALRVGGVGSVGTRCMIVLLQGGADDDGLILQLKEAGPSTLEAYLPPRKYAQYAQRIVTGQQLMQTTNDIFLGWHSSKYSGSDYYWRQLKDMKGSVNVAKLDDEGLNSYIELCALCLARAHARTGDASTIAGYLGRGKSFDTAVADFAMTYADQTERDYQLLVEAVDAGRIVAAKGI